MQAAMALAKLKVKNVRMDTGIGSIPDLTPEDIAAGLAGCTPVAYYLGLYKYAGDRSVLNDLEKHVFANIGQIAYDKRWFDDGQYSAMCRFLNSWHSGELKGNQDAMDEQERTWCKTVHQLARLLVDEVVFENTHKTCGGTGIYQRSICKGCGGTGRRPSSGRDNARFLNVSKNAWIFDWEPLFDRFFPVVHSWEQTVLGHLQRKLYDAKEQELVNAMALVKRCMPRF